MKRTIVTGASGFIGANLARRLIADGNETHVFTRPDSDPWRLDEIRHDVHFHHIALDDAEGVMRDVASIKPDCVFHLAAHGGYSWQTDAQRIVRSNVVGTVNLVEACLKVGFDAFVNAGSSSEYGVTDHAPSEKDPLEPNSVYAVTKATATMYCRHIARTKDVQMSTLRLYSAFGPFEESRRLIPSLILRGLDGELPPLTDPNTARDFVYIDDVVDAFLLAASRSTQERGAIYNVGTGVQTTVRDAVEVAQKVLKISAAPRWGTMPDRSWDTTVWVADNQKIRTELDWSPQHTFEQGFRRAVEWFRTNPKWERFYRDLSSMT
jgi:nucleoside-diphosphate-sugar epimerase